MNKQKYELIERYMLQNMQLTVHDPAHIYRVLFAAMRIAETEPTASMEVVMLAALLHDIGRVAEDKDPSIKHAPAGAAMAYDFLRENGWAEETAAHVRDCINTHSHKGGEPPANLEAKILYDADKYDLTGAIGMARALQYGQSIGEPLYSVDEDNNPLKGERSEGPSFFREYRRKLRYMQDIFFTAEGKRMAAERQETMDAYMKAMKREVKTLYKEGKARLQKNCE